MTRHKLQIRLGAVPSGDAEVLIDGMAITGCIRKLIVTAEVGSATKVELELVGVSVDLVADAEVRAKIVDLTDDES